MPSSLIIEGGLLAPDIAEQIAELPGQRPADFGLSPNRTLADSVTGLFVAARAHWQLFQDRVADAPDTASLTTMTRQQWIVPLLGLLDYQLVFQRSAELVDGRPYSISHRAGDAETAPPVHIVSIEQPLGERAGSGRGSIAPHGLLQDYLNRTEELWGIVTNGYTLRLLRDSSHFSRPSYVEFDLRQIFDGEQLDEFLLFYRLVHRSRLTESGSGANCTLERYHLQAVEQGDRIRNGLCGAVEQAIVYLANGLLQHPRNTALRERIQQKQLSERQFYQHLLYLIYRLLFLMVAEERNLLTDASNTLYRDYYSIARLRQLSEQPLTAPERFDDLWLGLQSLFEILRDERLARMLGLPALNGLLFEQRELDQALINNRELLLAMRAFSSFVPEGESGRRRVNYSALDVEELGSVYESLLDYQPAFRQDAMHGLRFELVRGETRRSTGSYYTDRSLVNELISAALMPVISEKLQAVGVRSGPGKRRGTGSLADPQIAREAETALLAINVLDPACGSGHFLLAAARRIGRELARVRAAGDEPSADAVRAATREAIAHCVYGVDRNELAVDLCKVALWIEGQSQGKPLGFLDHRIRHGDSLVGVLRNDLLQEGIPDAAYDSASGDDKVIARALKKRNKAEREGQQYLGSTFHEAAQSQNMAILLELPDDTPEQVRRKRFAFEQMRSPDTAWWQDQLANHLYTAAFFMPFKPGNLVPTTASLTSTDTFRKDLIGATIAMAHKQAFFHWQQEFQDVFASGGFDVVLGNPPFVGGLKISGNYGDKYRKYLVSQFSGFADRADLCAAFFRRAFSVLRQDGMAGLIATNTIGQGDTREAGLGQLVQSGATLHYARRFVKWSGDANVEVNLVGWKKGPWKEKIILDLQEVEQISSRLDNEVEQKPLALSQNKNKAFQGHILRGIGFVLNKEDAARLLHQDIRNSDCILPYLNGDDVNWDIQQDSSRYVICFHDWPLKRAKSYPSLLNIVEEKVKPERDKVKQDKDRIHWWRFNSYRVELRQATEPLRRVLVRSRVSELHMPVFLSKGGICSEQLIVFAFDDDYHFALLQSNIHEVWVWRYSSSLESRNRYTPSDCFNTFPFPQAPAAEAEQAAMRVGGIYHEHRRQLMLARQEGLTRSYNRFHNPAESSNDIVQLRALHGELDNAILACYGWHDLDAGHGFHQNERGQTRYSISDTARREVLARLLALNLELAGRERESQRDNS